MSLLTIENLYKRYEGQKHFALENVSFELKRGELLSLVGENGSGKSTLLRCIAGFEIPSQGRILMEGKSFFDEKTFLEPEKRRTAVVFQEQALFPHLTVYENVAYGLSGYSKIQVQERVSEILELHQLSGYEKRYPHELSGGEQQRLSLTRALAPKPSILLLDEPFNSLNLSLHLELLRKLEGVIRELECTTIFVSHDKKDALSITDRVLVLRKGKIEQWDSPTNVYYEPQNEYVASFFGQINRFCVKKKKIPQNFTNESFLDFLTESTELEKENNTESIKDSTTKEERQLVFIRPENFVLDSQGICSQVKKLRFYGEYYEVLVSVLDRKNRERLLVLYVNPQTPIKKEKCLHFSVHSNAVGRIRNSS